MCFRVGSGNHDRWRDQREKSSGSWRTERENSVRGEKRLHTQTRYTQKNKSDEKKKKKLMEKKNQEEEQILEAKKEMR